MIIVDDLLSVVSKLRKVINLPPHWGSNPQTSVSEANAVPLAPQQTAMYNILKV